MIQLGELAHEIPDTGETRINLPAGGRIEPVTASARSRLGQRITFTAQDEAHDWDKRNGGRKLADTQRRNLAGTGGRFMETGNAWDPAQDSVAQITWERETGVFKLMLHGGPGSVRNMRERMKVLRQVYDGAPWVDVDRISSEIDNLIERGEYAQAERFFMNRIVAGEDRAFDIKRWREQARPGTLVPDASMITIGIDGARYRDAIAIIATEISSGYQWPLGIWERPPNSPDDYEHPLEEVDGVMIDAFNRFNVWRVYVDPGSQVANIGALMEKWQGRWGGKKVVEWLMTRPKPTAYMIRSFVSAVITGDVTHSGDETFTQHIRNARRRETTVYDEDGRIMHILSKESPASPAKIDAASAACLSWEARGDAIAAGAGTTGGYDDVQEMCGREGCGHIRRHHVTGGCRVPPQGHCAEFVESEEAA
jgi:hypothetical protein